MIMDGRLHVAKEHCCSITSYDSDLDWFRQVAPTGEWTSN